MTTIALTTPYSLKAATLSIAADDYTAAVSQVEFVPSTATASWTGIGGNVVSDVGTATWVCNLGLAQDLDPDGLLRYLLDNEGETVAAVFTPVSGGPSITATITLAPATIGGSAGAETATASVSLPVTGKPAFTDGAAVPTISTALPSAAGDYDVVSLSGSHFTGTTGVTVGGIAAVDFYVIGDSHLVLTMPVSTAGSAPIIVTNATGASAAKAYTRAD